MSARVRLAELHDRSGFDIDALAMACYQVPGQVFGPISGWYFAILFVYRTGLDPGPEFWAPLEQVAGRRDERQSACEAKP